MREEKQILEEIQKPRDRFIFAGLSSPRLEEAYNAS